MVEVIVCDCIEELERRKRQLKGENEIFCLTKNAELYLSECNKDIKINILESKKNYLEYADRTWDILDEINTCIKEGLKENAYVYQANYHLEGNTESMQVLTMLMLFDVFDNYFRGYKEINVFCFYNEAYSNEIEQLYFWCKSNKHKFHLELIGTRWESTKLRLAVLYRFGAKSLNGVTEVFSFYKRELRLFDLRKRGGQNNEKEAIYADIGIIKQSAYAKDYNWTKDDVEEWDKAEIKYRFICMNESDRRTWEEYGYEADNIEEFLPKDTIRKELRKYNKNKKKLWSILRKELKNRIDSRYISELGVIMKKCLYFRAGEILISNVAADEFFKKHNYKIITLHGDTNFKSSQICIFNAKKHNSLVKIKNTAGGFQMVRSISYEPYGYLSDFGFVLKDIENSYSKEERHRCESVGRKYPVKSHIYTEEFYRYLFNKDLLSGELRILWAPSNPSIGQIIYSRFIKTGLTLINHFETGKGKCFIKFHPSHPEGEKAFLVERLRSKINVEIVSSEDNIRDVLEKADVMITDCSLSIMDAVIRRKAVICVVCELERELLMHKEALYIIQEQSELKELLQKLSDDEKYRKRWIENRVRIQERYFSKVLADKKERNMGINILKKELSI